MAKILKNVKDFFILIENLKATDMLIVKSKMY